MQSFTSDWQISIVNSVTLSINYSSLAGLWTNQMFKVEWSWVDPKHFGCQLWSFQLNFKMDLSQAKLDTSLTQISDFFTNLLPTEQNKALQVSPSSAQFVFICCSISIQHICSQRDLVWFLKLFMSLALKRFQISCLISKSRLSLTWVWLQYHLKNEIK